MQLALRPIGAAADSAGSSPLLLLPPNQQLTIGRAQLAPTDARISRQHATVHVSAAELLLLTALKPVHIQPAAAAEAGRSEAIITLTPGQTHQLQPGDVVFFVRTSSGYAAGFTLCQQQQQQQQHARSIDGAGAAAATDAAAAAAAAAGSGDEQQPTPKRLKMTAAAANNTPPAAPTAGLGPFAATIAAAAAAAGSNTPQAAAAAAEVLTQGGSGGMSAGSQQQQGKLFAGVRLCDWDGHHTQMALRKAAEEGAQVTQWLEASTTHVIARFELSAGEVQRRLAAQAEKQRQQQQRQPKARTPLKRPSPSKALQSPGTAKQQPSDSHSPGAAAVGGSPQGLQQQQPEQQPCSSQDALVSAADISKLLPPSVQFVTLSWVSQSLKSRQRLPEGQFTVDLQQQLERSRSGAAADDADMTAAALPAQPADAVGIAAAAAAAAAVLASQGNGTAAAAASPASGAQQVLQQSSSDRAQRHLAQQHITVPGPEEICPADAVWGTCQRWIEPWDNAAALETMEKLMGHWNQTARKYGKAAAGPPAGAGAAGAATAMDGRSSDYDEDSEVPFQQQQQQAGQSGPGPPAAAAAAAAASACGHIACSQQGFCLVEEMQRLKRNYHGRTDQFRIKAASRAITELERLQQPITGPQGIEQLPIGDKSKAKLKEILATGRLRRNDVLEESEMHQALQLFMSVWGCGDATARKWWSEGCRSLDDVRQKANLTEIQQMGLKYYDDFEQRIPRHEVTEAVAIIKDTTLDVLQSLTGKPRPELEHLLHVRALGSYARGRADAGDIDMLLAAGPAAEDVPPAVLSAELLQRLMSKGYVPEGLSFDDRSFWSDRRHQQPDNAERVCVSWMGVWKGPSSPRFRRLDIKTYMRFALPFAVIYFSSGQDCSRAIRYWANRPTPEVSALAAAIHPAANSFHLSDSGLYCVFNAALAANSPRNRRRRASRDAAAAAAAAAGGGGGGGGGGASGGASGAAAAGAAAAGAAAAGAAAGDDDEDVGDPAAAVAAGLPIVTPNSHSPAGAGGRVECTCEAEIFKALGLSYVPPHLRSWQ